MDVDEREEEGGERERLRMVCIYSDMYKDIGIYAAIYMFDFDVLGCVLMKYLLCININYIHPCMHVCMAYSRFHIIFIYHT